MSNLKTIDLKAFVPSKNFKLSKAFYLDFGFTQASDTHGVAFFHCGNSSFFLQDFYDKSLAENFMMHLQVENVTSWHEKLTESNITEKYGVILSAITEQPWGILDFVVSDPSGVLWRIGQNI